MSPESLDRSCLRPAVDESRSSNVLGNAEDPASRVGGRRSGQRRKAKIAVQFADHSVLLGGNDVAAHNPGTAAACSLDRNVHSLVFELTAENAAAHDPADYLKYVRRAWVRTENHDAHETIVSKAVNKTKLQRDVMRRAGEGRHLLTGQAPCRGIKLIGFIDQLRGASQIHGRDRSKYHGHLQPAQVIVHALMRIAQ